MIPTAVVAKHDLPPATTPGYAIVAPEVADGYARVQTARTGVGDSDEDYAVMQLNPGTTTAINHSYTNTASAALGSDSKHPYTNDIVAPPTPPAPPLQSQYGPLVHHLSGHGNDTDLDL